MATTMLTKLSEELSVLESQLNTFKSTVEYLSDAKEGLNTAVKAVVVAEKYHESKLKQIEDVYERNLDLIEVVDGLIENINEINFPNRLDGIDKRLGTVIQELNRSIGITMEEIRAAAQEIVNLNLDNKISELKRALIDSDKRNFDSTKERIDEIRNLSNSLHGAIQIFYAENSEKFEELSLTFEKMQLVSRLEQIKIQTNELSNEITDIKTCIKHNQEKLNGKIKDGQQIVEKSFQKLEFTVEQKLKQIKMENRIFYILIILTSLSIPLFQFLLNKK